MTDRHQRVDDEAPYDETLVVGPGGHQRPLQLNAQLLRNVAERLHVVGCRSDTVEIVLVEHVLRVEQAEHSQHQRAEERVDGSAQVEVGARVVGAQVGEERREDERVLFVQLTVRVGEHVVKVRRRAVQQLRAEH